MIGGLAFFRGCDCSGSTHLRRKNWTVLLGGPGRQNWTGLLRWHPRKNWTGGLCWHLCCGLLAGDWRGLLCWHLCCGLLAGDWRGLLCWHLCCGLLVGGRGRKNWSGLLCWHLFGDLCRKNWTGLDCFVGTSFRNCWRGLLWARGRRRGKWLVISQVLTARAAETAPKGFVFCKFLLRKLWQLPKIIILPIYVRQIGGINYQNMLVDPTRSRCTNKKDWIMWNASVAAAARAFDFALGLACPVFHSPLYIRTLQRTECNSGINGSGQS